MKQNCHPIILTTLTSTSMARRLALGVALATVLCWSALHAAIVPPDQLVFGKSYNEWNAAWWKWALETSSAGHIHPFYDRTGADALRNQTGPVWFLPYFLGPENVTNVIVRTVSIPDDKWLFVGLSGAECSTLEGNGQTEAELRACVETFIPSEVFVEIDGIAVDNLESFHTVSPQYSFNAPANNIAGVPGGGLGLSVGNGVDVMVEPLSPGSHTIHFGARYAQFNVAWDISYALTVYARPALKTRPLSGANLLELSWPDTNGFSLQQANSPEATATWTAASVISSSVNAGTRFVTVTNAPGSWFFRLFRP